MRLGQKTKRIMSAWLAAMLLIGGAAMAEPAEEKAEDLTALCEMRFSTKEQKKPAVRLRDGKYETRWKQQKKGEGWITFRSPDPTKPIAGLYLCFDIIPEKWEVQVPEEGGWRTVFTGDQRYLHAWVPIEEASEEIRLLIPKSGEKTQLAEIRVYGEGSFPDGAQDWQPTVTEADLLFLATHADDELIFFGGGIPTYAAERQNRVAVAYLTDCGPRRRNELLDGLWSMGVRNYPVIGPFTDLHKETMTAEYRAMGGKKKVLGWVVELLRSLRPKVIVTHDKKGEYGHIQHRLCAAIAQLAYDEAANPESYPESAERYGTWQAQKLYLHLYKENRITMDWTVPLTALGGITGIEAAERAYTYHVSQQGTSMSVTKTGTKYDNRIFGLCRTEVGTDSLGGDFLENILTNE